MTPEERSNARKRSRKWRAAHREEHRAYNRKYYQEHKAERMAYIRDWCRKHTGYSTKYGRVYRQTISGCLRDRYKTMKSRCENPKAINYERYGGRGIKCMFYSADEFVDYVVNTLKVDPRGLQIDRINNDGNYEAGNIRFVTAKVNANNRRDNV